jgi:RHS repeat-associated protein
MTVGGAGLNTPFGFVGGEGYQSDPDSGLMLLGARYYDPSIGRFISRDPIRYRGGDANLYRYCGNNPVNGIDPDGCFAQVPILVIVAIVATVVVIGIIIGIIVWPRPPRQDPPQRPDVYRRGQKNHPGIRSPRPKRPDGTGDIPVDENGMVYPGTGGQSHFEEPDPKWQYPWKIPGGSEDPPGLHWVFDDPKDKHWSLEPDYPMPLDKYKEYLRAIEDQYVPVDPGGGGGGGYGGGGGGGAGGTW